jgi:exopolyphosphatase / guanosine-5'-triphosphate,3'-diphosphate pyrophosphatase
VNPDAPKERLAPSLHPGGSRWSDSVRRAVIDVGTNSVKLLIADVAGQEVMPIAEDSKQTRLGKGFYETHRLQPGAIERTAIAVAKYARIARDWETEQIRIIATSAVRDAGNAQDLIDAVQSSCGLTLEIISGEAEADYVYHGVSSDPKLDGRPLLILDVGGGSTELIVGEHGRKYYRNSFPLGTVRLWETIQPSDPPGPMALEECRRRVSHFLASEVAPGLRHAIARCDAPPLLVGTGGTATILARLEGRLAGFERDQIEATILSQARMSFWVRHLWSHSLAQRKELRGLPAKRADIIIMGVAIYEAVMECFGFSELRVSTRGLRFGALMRSI